MENIIDDAFPETPARIRIIDEIGKMELLSQKMSRIFTDQIDKCRSDIFVCTIPLKSSHPIVLGSGKKRLDLRYYFANSMLHFSNFLYTTSMILQNCVLLSSYIFQLENSLRKSPWPVDATHVQSHGYQWSIKI